MTIVYSCGSNVMMSLLPIGSGGRVRIANLPSTTRTTSEA